MNEILRRAIAEAGLTEQDVAGRLGVDPKTVRRWLEGRRPYPRNRADIASLVGVDQDEIWRVRAPMMPSQESDVVEIEAAYAHRSSVPQAVWRWLFEQAEEEIGILSYAGLFLAEDVEILRILEKKAREGVSVRILLGDPDSPMLPNAVSMRASTMRWQPGFETSSCSTGGSWRSTASRCAYTGPSSTPRSTAQTMTCSSTHTPTASWRRTHPCSTFDESMTATWPVPTRTASTKSGVQLNL